jgi:hypothetical protein
MLEEADIKLKGILEQHSLNIVPYNDWLTVEGSLPCFRASIYNHDLPGEYVSLQLDVQVLVGAKTVVVESFSGLGKSFGEAMDQAFINFAFNSLHVFLGALCGRTDDQVTVEEWIIDNQEWNVFIGNLGVWSNEGQAETYPGSLSQTIENLIRQKELEPRIHWARAFYGNVGDGSAVCEFLLDNESWKYAEDTLRTLDWAKADSYYSVRNFLIMLPK